MKMKFKYAYSVVWLAHDWMKEDKIYRNVTFCDSDLPIDEFVKDWNEKNAHWNERIHKIEPVAFGDVDDEKYEWFVS